MAKDSRVEGEKPMRQLYSGEKSIHLYSGDKPIHHQREDLPLPAHADGEPLTRAQQQSRTAGSPALVGLLRPYAPTASPEGIEQVLKYLPLLLQLVTEIEQFRSMTIGQTADFGPVSSWLPGGDGNAHYDITLHVSRKG